MFEWCWKPQPGSDGDTEARPRETEIGSGKREPEMETEFGPTGLTECDQRIYVGWENEEFWFSRVTCV